MQDLSSIWNQVEALLSQNISIIPVRDKSDQKGVAKTPYQGWKNYQTSIISKEDLWQQMEKHNTAAIATICGKVSGNLEVIDIDIKNKLGVDAELFKLLSDFYPELLKRLRIHKTPSGGFHILYRVDRPIEGNQKLAGRAATEDELREKPKTKVYYYLETRGEGGYVVAPPSLGYSVHQFVDIPLITFEERCAIIQLCKSLSTYVKEEKEIKVSGYSSDFYSENPFDHFNNSPAAESVLLDAGWKQYNVNGEWVRYSRPGSKSPTDATFNKRSRFYFIWSGSSEFDADSWYTPATLLGQVLFNGDKSKLYHHLVNSGYGKIKSQVEKKIVQRAAITNTPLPANISDDAKNLYEQEKELISSKYPAGIFWKEEVDNFNNPIGYKISRERLYRVSEYLGYRIHNDEVCLIDGYIVHKVPERRYFDALRSYIKEEDADTYEDIINCFEAFLQKSGTFTVSRLPLLESDLLVQSSKSKSYKFFNNCYVEITHKVECKNYPIDGLIWHDQIQQRDFTINHDSIIPSLYYRYIYHAIGISDYLKSCIGYLSHEFKDEESGYIIVLTEQCPDPKQGGGSGKNIFSSLFRHTTTIKNIPGSQVQYNEKFLQAWNFERILSISDVPKRFDFTFLKELSTGTGILKKLWKDELAVQPHQMPKLLVSTNFSYEVSDGGIKRRIIPIEFTDFFTREGGVNTYFNAMFPADWSDADWQGYDNFVIECIQYYLSLKGKLKAPELTEGGWMKQFEQEHGQSTLQFIEENIGGWCALPYVKTETFNEQYDKFCHSNGINIKYRKSAQAMNAALRAWCEKRDMPFLPSEVRSENNIKYKVKIFGTTKEDEIPF